MRKKDWMMKWYRKSFLRSWYKPEQDIEDPAQDIEDRKLDLGDFKLDLKNSHADGLLSKIVRSKDFNLLDEILTPAKQQTIPKDELERALLLSIDLEEEYFLSELLDNIEYSEDSKVNALKLASQQRFLDGVSTLLQSMDFCSKTKDYILDTDTSPDIFVLISGWK